MRKTLTNILLALGIVTITPLSDSYAASTTANFQTTASLSSTCTISTWTDVIFGTLTPGSTSYTANEAFNTTCTKGTPYTVTTGYGNAGNSNRYMVGSTKGDKLYYNLYTDTSYTNIYGDGTSGTTKLSGTGTGNAQTTIIQVKMAPNQYVTPDSYNDSITLTVNY